MDSESTGLKFPDNYVHYPLKYYLHANQMLQRHQGTRGNNPHFSTQQNFHHPVQRFGSDTTNDRLTNTFNNSVQHFQWIRSRFPTNIRQMNPQLQQNMYSRFGENQNLGSEQNMCPRFPQNRNPNNLNMRSHHNMPTKNAMMRPRIILPPCPRPPLPPMLPPPLPPYLQANHQRFKTTNNTVGISNPNSSAVQPGPQACDVPNPDKNNQQMNSNTREMMSQEIHAKRFYSANRGNQRSQSYPRSSRGPKRNLHRYQDNKGSDTSDASIDCVISVDSSSRGSVTSNKPISAPETKLLVPRNINENNTQVNNDYQTLQSDNVRMTEQCLKPILNTYTDKNEHSKLNSTLKKYERQLNSSGTQNRVEVNEWNLLSPEPNHSNKISPRNQSHHKKENWSFDSSATLSCPSSLKKYCLRSTSKQVTKYGMKEKDVSIKLCKSTVKKNSKYMRLKSPHQSRLSSTPTEDNILRSDQRCMSENNLLLLRDKLHKFQMARIESKHLSPFWSPIKSPRDKENSSRLKTAPSDLKLSSTINTTGRSRSKVKTRKCNRNLFDDPPGSSSKKMSLSPKNTSRAELSVSENNKYSFRSNTSVMELDCKRLDDEDLNLTSRHDSQNPCVVLVSSDSTNPVLPSFTDTLEETLQYTHPDDTDVSMVTISRASSNDDCESGQDGVQDCIGTSDREFVSDGRDGSADEMVFLNSDEGSNCSSNLSQYTNIHEEFERITEKAIKEAKTSKMSLKKTGFTPAKSKWLLRSSTCPLFSPKKRTLAQKDAFKEKRSRTRSLPVSKINLAPCKIVIEDCKKVKQRSVVREKSTNETSTTTNNPPSNTAPPKSNKNNKFDEADFMSEKCRETKHKKYVVTESTDVKLQKEVTLGTEQRKRSQRDVLRLEAKSHKAKDKSKNRKGMMKRAPDNRTASESESSIKDCSKVKESTAGGQRSKSHNQSETNTVISQRQESKNTRGRPRNRMVSKETEYDSKKLIGHPSTGRKPRVHQCSESSDSSSVRKSTRPRKSIYSYGSYFDPSSSRIVKVRFPVNKRSGVGVSSSFNSLPREQRVRSGRLSLNRKKRRQTAAEEYHALDYSVHSMETSQSSVESQITVKNLPSVKIVTSHEQRFQEKQTSENSASFNRPDHSTKRQICQKWKRLALTGVKDHRSAVSNTSVCTEETDNIKSSEPVSSPSDREHRETDKESESVVVLTPDDDVSSLDRQGDLDSSLEVSRRISDNIRFHRRSKSLSLKKNVIVSDDESDQLTDDAVNIHVFQDNKVEPILKTSMAPCSVIDDFNIESDTSESEEVKSETITDIETETTSMISKKNSGQKGSKEINADNKQISLDKGSNMNLDSDYETISHIESKTESVVSNMEIRKLSSGRGMVNEHRNPNQIPQSDSETDEASNANREGTHRNLGNHQSPQSSSSETGETVPLSEDEVSNANTDLGESSDRNLGNHRSPQSSSSKTDEVVPLSEDEVSNANTDLTEGTHINLGDKKSQLSSETDEGLSHSGETAKTEAREFTQRRLVTSHQDNTDEVIPYERNKVSNYKQKHNLDQADTGKKTSELKRIDETKKTGRKEDISVHQPSNSKVSVSLNLYTSQGSPGFREDSDATGNHQKIIDSPKSKLECNQSSTESLQDFPQPSDEPKFKSTSQNSIPGDRPQTRNSLQLDKTNSGFRKRISTKALTPPRNKRPCVPSSKLLKTKSSGIVTRLSAGSRMKKKYPGNGSGVDSPIRKKTRISDSPQKTQSMQQRFFKSPKKAEVVRKKTEMPESRKKSARHDQKTSVSDTKINEVSVEKRMHFSRSPKKIVKTHQPTRLFRSPSTNREKTTLRDMTKKPETTLSSPKRAAKVQPKTSVLKSPKNAGKTISSTEPKKIPNIKNSTKLQYKTPILRSPLMSLKTNQKKADVGASKKTASKTMQKLKESNCRKHEDLRKPYPLRSKSPIKNKQCGSSLKSETRDKKKMIEKQAKGESMRAKERRKSPRKAASTEIPKLNETDSEADEVQPAKKKCIEKDIELAITVEQSSSKGKNQLSKAKLSMASLANEVLSEEELDYEDDILYETELETELDVPFELESRPDLRSNSQADNHEDDSADRPLRDQSKKNIIDDHDATQNTNSQKSRKRKHKRVGRPSKRQTGKQHIENPDELHDSQPTNSGTQKEHVKPRIVIVAGKINRCPYCFAEFPKPESLRHHVAKVHPHRCDVCHSEFTNRNEAKNHRITHYDKLYHCKLCQRDFRFHPHIVKRHEESIHHQQLVRVQKQVLDLILTRYVHASGPEGETTMPDISQFVDLINCPTVLRSDLPEKTDVDSHQNSSIRRFYFENPEIQDLLSKVEQSLKETNAKKSTEIILPESSTAYDQDQTTKVASVQPMVPTTKSPPASESSAVNPGIERQSPSTISQEGTIDVTSVPSLICPEYAVEAFNENMSCDYEFSELNMSQSQRLKTYMQSDSLDFLDFSFTDFVPIKSEPNTKSGSGESININKPGYTYDVPDDFLDFWPGNDYAHFDCFYDNIPTFGLSSNPAAVPVRHSVELTNNNNLEQNQPMKTFAETLDSDAVSIVDISHFSVKGKQMPFVEKAVQDGVNYGGNFSNFVCPTQSFQSPIMTPSAKQTTLPRNPSATVTSCDITPSSLMIGKPKDFVSPRKYVANSIEEEFSDLHNRRVSMLGSNLDFKPHLNISDSQGQEAFVLKGLSDLQTPKPDSGCSSAVPQENLTLPLNQAFVSSQDFNQQSSDTFLNGATGPQEKILTKAKEIGTNAELKVEKFSSCQMKETNCSHQDSNQSAISDTIHQNENDPEILQQKSVVTKEEMKPVGLPERSVQEYDNSSFERSEPTVNFDEMDRAETESSVTESSTVTNVLQQPHSLAMTPQKNNSLQERSVKSSALAQMDHQEVINPLPLAPSQESGSCQERPEPQLIPPKNSCYENAVMPLVFNSFSEMETRSIQGHNMTPEKNTAFDDKVSDVNNPRTPIHVRNWPLPTNKCNTPSRKSLHPIYGCESPLPTNKSNTQTPSPKELIVHKIKFKRSSGVRSLPSTPTSVSRLDNQTSEHPVTVDHNQIAHTQHASTAVEIDVNKSGSPKFSSNQNNFDSVKDQVSCSTGNARSQIQAPNMDISPRSRRQSYQQVADILNSFSKTLDATKIMSNIPGEPEEDDCQGDAPLKTDKKQMPKLETQKNALTSNISSLNDPDVSLTTLINTLLPSTLSSSDGVISQGNMDMSSNNIQESNLDPSSKRSLNYPEIVTLESSTHTPDFSNSPLQSEATNHKPFITTYSSNETAGVQTVKFNKTMDKDDVQVKGNSLPATSNDFNSEKINTGSKNQNTIEINTNLSELHNLPHHSSHSVSVDKSPHTPIYKQYVSQNTVNCEAQTTPVSNKTANSSGNMSLQYIEPEILFLDAFESPCARLRNSFYDKYISASEDSLDKLSDNWGEQGRLSHYDKIDDLGDQM